MRIYPILHKTRIHISHFHTNKPLTICIYVSVNICSKHCLHDNIDPRNKRAYLSSGKQNKLSNLQPSLKVCQLRNNFCPDLEKARFSTSLSPDHDDDDDHGTITSLELLRPLLLCFGFGDVCRFARKSNQVCLWIDEFI